MKKVYTVPQFADALEKLGSHVRGEVIQKAALAGGFTIEAHAKLNVRAKFKQHTGMLLGKWEVKVITSNDIGCRVHTSPLMIYARIQELGGTIKATKAKYLHWVDEQGNHHQAKQVHLPARPYLRPAVNENETAIIDSISGVLKKEIEGSI